MVRRERLVDPVPGVHALLRRLETGIMHFKDRPNRLTIFILGFNALLWGVIILARQWLPAGMEYQSSVRLLGLPLVASGRMPVAWVAIGGVPIGAVALGGISLGVIAFGGVGIGIWAVGGGAAGLLAVGGIALGLLVAVGGGALGFYALGGLAIGGIAYAGRGMAYGYFLASGKQKERLLAGRGAR